MPKREKKEKKKKTARKKGEIIEELHEIEKKEEELLDKVNWEIRKSRIEKNKRYREVEHFSFKDFVQIMIGCCVFGLPAFINTSFWDYLPNLSTHMLSYIHCFFMVCVILALNYEFREIFTLKKGWFVKMLLKRFFFTYFSVFMIITILLILVVKMGYSITNLDVLRHFLAAQSVGMFGAVTFTFLKR